MSDPNPKADWFFNETGTWHDAFARLRTVCLDCELDETVKWGNPCYLRDGRNIVLIHGFKDYCALLFFKGALMNDPDNLLIQQTENVQSARQIRFTSLDEVIAREAALKAYINDAVAVEQSGAKVTLKTTAQFAMPEEFRVRLEEQPELKAAFDKLTPGRQKGYLLHFGSAKQAKTREARIAKCVDLIFDGKGLDD